MEVSLRKPQRAIFKMMQENPGCYLRHHKKTVNATRLYWRLMTKDHSPLMNITPGNLKQFFNLSLLVSIGQREWGMKDSTTTSTHLPGYTRLWRNNTSLIEPYI
jgi:hypothetical protein